MPHKRHPSGLILCCVSSQFPHTSIGMLKMSRIALQGLTDFFFPPSVCLCFFVWFYLFVQIRKRYCAIALFQNSRNYIPPYRSRHISDVCLICFCRKDRIQQWIIFTDNHHILMENRDKTTAVACLLRKAVMLNFGAMSR